MAKEEGRNLIPFQRTRGKADQMNLLSCASSLRTKESWSVADIGFIPNCDSTSPAREGDILILNSFITLGARVHRHTTDEGTPWDRTYSLPVSQVPGTVLDARDAAETWLKPSGPDRHSTANGKQSIQHLLYDPCSQEASRGRGRAR